MPSQYRECGFNFRLPATARPCCKGGKIIGWVWPVKTIYLRLDPSVRRIGKQVDRYAACLLDGQLVTRNSRTVLEARRGIEAAIRRRVEGRSRKAKYVPKL